MQNKRLLIIGASKSANSINRTLAGYAGSLISDSESTILDLNDFEMPIYSGEREESGGIPEEARIFVQKIEEADGIILSLAEHNGSYSAAFKNILDWSIRHKQKLWSEKPVLLLSTSPGGRGGATVLEAAKQTFPHLGAKIAATFSLPSFYDKFSEESGINDAELNTELRNAVDLFTKAVAG